MSHCPSLTITLGTQSDFPLDLLLHNYCRSTSVNVKLVADLMMSLLQLVEDYIENETPAFSQSILPSCLVYQILDYDQQHANHCNLTAIVSCSLYHFLLEQPQVTRMFQNFGITGFLADHGLVYNLYDSKFHFVILVFYHNLLL